MPLFHALDTLLARKNQRFVCNDNGWPKPGKYQHIAHITHETSPALDTNELALLNEKTGNLPQLAMLYARYGSVRLYCDSVFNEPWGCYASAFYLAHPSEWEELSLCFNAWLDGLDSEEEEELLPAWLEHHVVIGEIPSSGNYFLLALQGEEAGSVFEFEHDGFEFIKQGDSLDDFITHWCTVSDALLRDIASHTRYFDGTTDTQWLVTRYEHD